MLIVFVLLAVLPHLHLGAPQLVNEFAHPGYVYVRAGLLLFVDAQRFVDEVVHWVCKFDIVVGGVGILIGQGHIVFGISGPL